LRKYLTRNREGASRRKRHQRGGETESIRIFKIIRGFEGHPKGSP